MSEIDSNFKGTGFGTSIKAQYKPIKLWVYCLVISLGAFQFGYALGIYSPISLVLMSLYHKNGTDWSPDNKEPLNTLVNTTLYIGAFAGSVLSPLFLKLRRFHAILIYNILCLVGGGLTAFISLPMLFTGQFLHGFGAGGFSFLIPIILNQVSPPSIRGSTAVLNQFQVTFGILVASLIGLGLPHTVQQVRSDDYLWRIMSAFPVLVAVVQILLFLTVYRLDTPQKYLELNDIESARKALEYVYSKQGATIRVDEITRQSKGGSSVHDPMVNKLSWNSKKSLTVCLLFSVLQQLTGMNGIIFYSSQIFGSKDNNDIYSGITIACLVGAVNFGATIISMLVVEKLGRKIMIIIGFIVMAICDVLTGIFEDLDYNVPQQVSVLLFVVAFEFSAGPLLWLYMPEVLNGAGVSAGTVVNWVFVIIISISTPQLANHIGEWMFYIFAIFNVIGAIFLGTFLIESKGRSKIELQALYRGQKVNQLKYEDDDMDFVSEGKKLIQ